MNPFRIAQLSDIHCGSPHFVPELLDRAIEEVNELARTWWWSRATSRTTASAASTSSRPSTWTGSTASGMIVIPGNHDSRNVGYVHFEELFGERRSELHQDGVSIVAVDSTEPDLDHGVIGRGRYELDPRALRGQRGLSARVRAPPPPAARAGTGRERNVVHDAGDTLETPPARRRAPGPSGHKHVPYAWRLEDLFVVNAGTVSTTRLRGKTKPCYNLVEATPERVRVLRRNPGRAEDQLLAFDPRTYEYDKDPSLLGGDGARLRRPQCRGWRKAL